MGTAGIIAGCALSTKRFINSGKLSQYKLQLQFNGTKTNRILKWVDYISKNFDLPPHQVIPTKGIDELGEIFEDNPKIKLEELKEVLNRLKINDDFEKSAKLLLVFTDNDETELIKMAKVICHNCDKMGHTVSMINAIISKAL